MPEKKVTFTTANIEVEDDEGIGTETVIETRACIKEDLPSQCVITRGLQEGTLYIYARDSFNDFSERMRRELKELPPADDASRNIRTVQRFFIAEAELVEVERCADGFCSLPIPGPLLEYFDVSESKSYISRFVEAGEDYLGARWELVDQETAATSACFKKAGELYGKELPAEVRDRLEMELSAIREFGYLDAMLFEKRLINHAAESGLHAIGVGGIGASFAAFLLGITEVNPLPAHYYCPRCHHFEWPEGPDDAGGVSVIGYDLPEKACPECGHELTREGFNIPFEILTTCQFNKSPAIAIKADAAAIHKLQQWVLEEYEEESVPEEPWYLDAEDVGELLGSDKAKALLHMREPSFLNQMRVLAIIEDEGEWGRAVSLQDENMPFFRDDVYLQLINDGLSKEDADAAMTAIRKGRLAADRNAWIVEVLEAAGVDQIFIENCKQIRYLRHKADLAAELLQYRKHRSQH